MNSYAKRMADQIDTSRPFCLLGVSFGGMMAIEMLRLIQPVKTIIVSSVRHRGELPWYGRLISSLGLHRLASPSMTLRLALLLNRMLGPGSEADRALIQTLICDTDIKLLHWSVDRALNWESMNGIAGLTHIHGTADRALPARFVNPDIWVQGGTHLIIFNRAAEISTIVDDLLTRVQG